MPEPEDLLHRLRAELQRATTAFDTLFNTLPVGIGIAEDPQCRHVRINPAAAQQLGIEPGSNASLTAPEDERPTFKLLVDGREVPPEDLPMQRAARTASEVGPVECEVVHADGRRNVLYEHAAPLFDDRGNVRGALGVFVDITDRRRVEQEQRFLARASELLSSSLDYTSTLAALAQLAVPFLGDYCAVDVLRDDGTFARVEVAVADDRKRDLADGLKRYPPVLTVHSPAAEVIRSGRAVIISDCPREVLERSAQTPEHLELLVAFGVCRFMMAPLTARGRTLGLIAIGTFDPERRYTERDLDLAVDVARRAGLALDNALLYRNAQEANRLKEEFLATLSHELRTPLNALLGWTQMLQARADDEALRKRAVESIERNAQAQAVLVNDLLDVSRVISGKLALQMLPVDLHAVMLAAADTVRPAVRARNIELSLSLGPIAGRVLGDAYRLQQIVWNLLANAVKFTPPGGRIDLSVEQTGGAVQISVSDTGAGIDPEFLQHVFERFRQGDSSTTRTHGGLGLGLAIVRHLVELHGGSASVESAGVGRGARFTVTLPLRVIPAEQDDVRPVLHAHGGASLRGVRVLAVDDDPDSRELMLLVVQDAGGNVMAVSSAEAALDAVRTFSPHVIVADIAMPRMDGYELLRRLSREGYVVPAIALSGHVTPEDVQRSLEAGFAFHLNKPANYQRLIETIAALAGAAAE